MFGISSLGPAGSVQARRMGRYLKVEGVTKFDRPVYRKERGHEYLYYSPSGYWSVGPNFNQQGYLRNDDHPLLAPPASNWLYIQSAKFKLDPQLKVQEDENQATYKEFPGFAVVGAGVALSAALLLAATTAILCCCRNQGSTENKDLTVGIAGYQARGDEVSFSKLT